MNILIMVIQGLLIFLFLVAGFFKLAQTREKIMSSGGAWAADISATNIKIIGVLECALSLILLLTLFVPVSPVLTQIACTGMGLVMLSAAYLHIKRKEYGFVVFTFVLSLMAFFLLYQTVPC
jgi:hypothetical protein